MKDGEGQFLFGTLLFRDGFFDGDVNRSFGSLFPWSYRMAGTFFLP